MGKRELSFRPDYAVPPGETLREVLESASMTQAQLASRTGRPRKTINEIIKGKAALTAETALQLEKVLGVPASFWLGLERVYRENLARIAEQKALLAGKGWLEPLPYKSMVQYGWVEDRPDTAGRVREALAFFGVASPKAWSALWEAPQAAFRRSKAFASQPGAVAAWLRRGEMLALQLTALCASAGVAVVFVRGLLKARVSGATRWLTPDKALVQLSLRYRTDDHLWFSFFREAGHVLLHGRQAFIEEDDGDGQEEKEQSIRRRHSDSAAGIRKAPGLPHL